MRFSRAVVALMTLLLLVLGTAIPATAEDLRAEDLPRVAVTIDGVPLNADAYVVNGRTVVPLRAIFEALGAKVDWDGATRTVTGTKGNRVIKLTIDQTQAAVDGKPVLLAVPGMIINSRSFVPLRFVGEALNADVSFDSATRTVIVKTDAGCTLTGGQKHQGTIKPGGETWGLCGSPHIVTGTFTVAGADNPVLTIEAGALVQFEARGSFDVGNGNPGGLMVKGTPDKPVTLTSALASPKSGDWVGIHFGELTLQNFAAIENAVIQYAGGNTHNDAAITASMSKGDLPIAVKNVAIKNSLGAGIRLWGGAQLSPDSGNITITGTTAANGQWGYPIVTDAAGLGSLPGSISIAGNALNAVDIYHGSGGLYVTRDTTVRNLLVPYVVGNSSLAVEGPQNPTLTIMPGVVMLFQKGGSLIVGSNGPGSLVADATNGAIEAWNGQYRTLLDDGAKLADGKSITTGNPAWATNQAIVFGTTELNPVKGSWVGIQFLRNTGSASKLAGAVVNWAGGVRDDTAAVGVDGNVRVGIDKSLVMNSAQNGIRLWSTSEFSSFTGNYMTQTVDPLGLSANAAGSIGTGNDFSGNTNEWIDFIGSLDVSKSQTWLNHGVPYHVSQTVDVTGPGGPVLTIEPGSKLLFAMDRGLRIGDDANGTGSLVAVGTADKPIIFTSELGRPGTWEGLTFGNRAGKDNKVEYAQISYAKTGVLVRPDLGSFLKNVTISGSSVYGINRGYPTASGTDFTKEATINFDANAKNQK